MTRIPLILAVALAMCIGFALAADAPKKDAPKNPDPVAQATEARNRGWFTSDGSQLVFFAVLEGLYEDGVSQEIVDIVVPMQYDNATAGHRLPHVHFIYTCPLCHPASEAFLLYAARQPFRGQKTTKVDTFATTGGLPASIEKKLRSEKHFDRLEGLRMALDRWIARRLDMMRLQPDERKVWEQKIAALRDVGNAALAQFQKGGNGDYYKNMYAAWKFCPSCDGSASGCKIKDRNAHE